MATQPPLRNGTTVAALLLAVLAWPLAASAVDRGVARDVRDAYEGRSLRLRVDLKSAAQAIEPNTISLLGIGYGREGSPVLFNRLERVYIDRITSEGGTRLGLTVYRSAEEMKRLRASAIPPPILGNPAASSTMAAFARTGSTTVMLELKAGKKDPGAQRREIETLLARLFYLDAEPTRQELEQFILEHRTFTVPRLAATTGLPPDLVRQILADAP